MKMEAPTIAVAKTISRVFHIESLGFLTIPPLTLWIAHSGLVEPIFFKVSGAAATVMWAAPATLSLTVALYGVVSDDLIDETDAILAILGVLGLGFAVGNYAMTLALERIAIGLSLAIAVQSSDARRLLST